MEAEKWETWWAEFIKNRKLVGKIEELDAVDKMSGREQLTKKICFEVYNHYDEIKEQREEIKKLLLNELGELKQVHLQSGRVKQKDSLIEKIIRKRYEYIGSEKSRYAKIDNTNYMDIITDLVGIRLIVNYRGKWQEIHSKILKDYPLLETEKYEGVEHLPHIKGKQFLAEIPIVYYAEGDNVEAYRASGMIPKLHKQGYRSIHYILSYDECYVELQVRTIYDEAWSDCDHNYVYKHEANPSNRALKKLSAVLCEITNVASDIGDNMHDIFNMQKFSETEGLQWLATEQDVLFFREMLTRLKKAENALEEFSGQLVIREDKE